MVRELAAFSLAVSACGVIVTALMLFGIGGIFVVVLSALAAWFIALGLDLLSPH